MLTGHDEESIDVRERAHYAFVNAADADGAARVAFWLGLMLLLSGRPAQANGWFGRFRTVLGDDAYSASVWPGYERLNQGMMALFGRDEERSLALLAEALTIADSFDDPDLRLLSASGHGQALLALGRSAEGMSELDEVMVLAMTGGANPQAVGQVYCAVIAVCRNCLDLTRSTEWTAVLGRWCDDQPDLVPYRGQCLVHRSEVLQVRGQWDDAAREVEMLLDRWDTYGRDVAAGMALYQRGELHRLRGDFRAAERAYREALSAGHDPQPGLALLRMAQGRADTALLALTRALDEIPASFARARLLPAVVEVGVAAGDLTIARSAAAELAERAGSLDVGYLRAAAEMAGGTVLLAEGKPAEALGALRRADREWGRIDAKYEIARCRVLVASACQALGDTETAELERDAARRTFVDLGARHDLVQLDHAGPVAVPAPDRLTPRELEVLRLLSTGATNRDIAARLVLSERTVARHVANIFVKIRVSARAAATAYAYDHGLV